MVKYYSQLDYKWAGYPIGKTRLFLGRYGCTICALCTMLSKMGIYMTPIEAANTWKFTDQGLLIWGQTDFGKAKFEARTFAYNEYDMKKWLADPKHGAVIQVDNFHWLCADKFSKLGLGLLAIDPLGGNQIRPLKKYHKITGAAYFILNQ